MYREASRIGDTLTDTIGWLANWDRTSEVVLVDDGSPDNTVEVVQAFLTDLPSGNLQCVRLVTLKKNLGKGGAVRAGLAASRGEMVLMMDADNAATIREVDKLVSLMTADTGIVAGSRNADDAQVDAVAFRALTGLVFRLALAAMRMNVISDTQCGFKLYSRSASDLIVKLCTHNDYVFDLEHMLLARRAGLAVKERGIAWKHIEGGQVSAISDGIKMLRATVKLRRKLNSISDKTIRKAMAESPKSAVMIEAKPPAMVMR
ncbi:MAG: hypothetical protein COB69_07105 [Phycisphaera sp.]|nr:MAG: hypothetical protein COB69_07105 [Phycisphaera sp.]